MAAEDRLLTQKAGQPLADTPPNATAEAGLSRPCTHYLPLTSHQELQSSLWTKKEPHTTPDKHGEAYMWPYKLRDLR